MNYKEALDWIHSRSSFGIQPGTDRMKWMLSKLGDPQEKIKAVHVVGTNGKGSTVNYLQHIFSQAGYEVGTFTSPCIIDFKDRIRINNEMITEKDLVNLVECSKAVVERLPLETDLGIATEFEVVTLLMFLYFGYIHPVDISFIEAGLGGLHDSTNIFKALAVVCTSIGLDHPTILGDSHDQIITQKIGVLKNQVPLIFASYREDIRKICLTKAKETDSKCFEFGVDFRIRKQDSSFDFFYQDESILNIELSMLGKHQFENASLAIMTSIILKESYPKINSSSIKMGLLTAKWAGRTELLQDNLMIDGAHNNESVSALTDLLDQQFADKSIHILFAAINHKPVNTMLQKLSKYVDLTVTSFSHPDAIKLDDYPSEYKKINNCDSWLKLAKYETSEDLFVVTGSLYFVSQVRRIFLLEY